MINAKTIDLKSSKIYIGKGILAKVGADIASNYKNAKALIVTDKNLETLYLDNLKSDLDDNDVLYNTIVFLDGEETKTFACLEKICERAADMNLNRGDMIIALGGGVVGDLAGFAAAVYLRGLKFVSIPTTLLAQVDSSVGGKTGINLPQGKNLVGSFYKADKVYIDTDTLKTLNDDEFRCGISEVIKYGCIRDETFFSLLEKLDTRDKVMKRIDHVVERCCEIKAQVVGQDEFDKGLRMILNFGHTIGHAIERVYGYGEFSHGEAVAIGMVMITEASEKKGITKRGTSDRLKKLLEKHNLKIKILNLDKKKIFDAAMKDKKNIGKSLNIVIIEEIGKVKIEKIKPEEMVQFI
jgi:3-dehydroquinate synthase